MWKKIITPILVVCALWLLVGGATSYWIERLIGEEAESLSRRQYMLNAARLLCLIGGPAIGILIGVWIARGRHRSISRISVTLNDASGKLDEEMGVVEITPCTDP